MPKDKETQSDNVKVITMLKLDNGMVIDSEELTPEQREAYIEFAIHLAAPKIASMLSEGLVHSTPPQTQTELPLNEAFF
jgi:hypothetical protein